jgi:dihydrodipicolinate synthase/N-acetylneuraminate lyase
MSEEYLQQCGGRLVRFKRTILGTCCVPWNEDGTLAEDIFRDSIRHLLRHGLPDLYLFGTAGEGYAITDSLFDRIVCVFAEEMSAGGAAPMVGVISLSLPTILERIERAGAMGVRLFQVSLPSWGAVTDHEMFTFFDEVCNRFPDFQFLHYNLPRTKRLVTPDEYRVLGDKHRNLVATKYGGSDLSMINGLLRRAGDLRHFFGDVTFSAGSLLGECGYLISIGSSNLRRARRYFEAGLARDVKTLTAMQQELVGMHDALIKAVGTTAHMDGAFDKIFSRMHDRRFPLRLLPPYQGASVEAFEQYCAALREHYPAWIEETRSD